MKKVTWQNEKPSQTKTKLTHELKRHLESRVKRLYINKEFIDFISETIAELPTRDKLAALYYFKKLAVQTLRQPDPEHYKAFEDEYREEHYQIADEQKHYEPVRWINAEIEYIKNSAERLTIEDVNERLNVMQDAKKRLSKDWLTQREMMSLFSFSKSTLNRRIAEGMPAHKNGKFVYFYLEEVNAWMKQDAA